MCILKQEVTGSRTTECWLSTDIWGELEYKENAKESNHHLHIWRKEWMGWEEQDHQENNSWMKLIKFSEMRSLNSKRQYIKQFRDMMKTEWFIKIYLMLIRFSYISYNFFRLLFLTAA